MLKNWFCVCVWSATSESFHKSAEPFGRHQKSLAFFLFCFSVLCHFRGGTKPGYLRSWSRVCWCYKKSLNTCCGSPVEVRWLSATIVISFWRGLIGVFLISQILTHYLYCARQWGKNKQWQQQKSQYLCPRQIPLQASRKKKFPCCLSCCDCGRALRKVWQRGLWVQTVLHVAMKIYLITWTNFF